MAGSKLCQGSSDGRISKADWLPEVAGNREESELEVNRQATVQERAEIERRSREALEEILEDPMILDRLERWRCENRPIPLASDWINSEA